MNEKLTTEQEKTIVNLLKFKLQREIAEEFQVSQSRISQIKRKYNVTTTKKGCKTLIKKRVNEEYFKNIDSGEKAYWLGYLVADGCTTKEKNKVTLSSKDEEVILKFKNATQAEHKISKVTISDKRTNKKYCRYSIQITNTYFVNNLLKWGINENKTDIFVFPNIDEKYFSYFIAGLFDGDGSVYLDVTNSYLKCNLISTKEVLTFIQEYFLNKFNIPHKALIRISLNKKNVYKVYWGTFDSIKILNYIYNGDKNIYLSRKYNMYSEYKDKLPSRKRNHVIQQIDSNGAIVNVFYGVKSLSEYINLPVTTLYGKFKKNNNEIFFNNYIWKKIE